MIRHVAVFRFVPEFTRAQREQWLTLLRSLPEQIPELRSLTAGVDVLDGPASHDIAIVADFDDLAGLAAYSEHPAHAEVLRISGPVKQSLATVDFVVAEP